MADESATDLRETNDGQTFSVAASPPVDTRPFAGCRACREVLICTFERAGLEYHCMGCGRWWEWLQSIDVPYTAALKERHTHLLDLFRAGVRGPAPDPQVT